MNSYAVICVAVIGLIVVIRLIGAVCHSMSASEYEFVCPHCGKRFFTKWYKLIPSQAFWLLGNLIVLEFKPRARLKCPACAKKGVCYIPDRYPADFKPPIQWQGKRRK